jgi:hypothetical protein
LLLVAAALTLSACAPPGPSIKERADEALARKRSNKEREEFAKSLPPTDAKPIYKP